MKFYTLKLTIIALLLPLCAIAQVQDIKGQIRDTDGNAINLASIIDLTNPNNVANSDKDGSFTIRLSSLPAKLRVSYIGFETQELVITKQLGNVVVLKLSIAELDEVIFKGYGSTTQRLNTGNIVKVTAKEIASQPISNPLAALQGKVAGMTISQTSGVPGSSFKVEIRGRTSVDQSLSKNDPLFVIDGVFFEAGNQPSNLLRSAANDNFGLGGLSPLNSINPSDIEHIEVLKDADATAIYGSRGANGVVLITTKKGKSGKTKVTFGYYTGASRVVASMGMLNTQQYVAMRKEGFANDGLLPSSQSAIRGFAPDIMLWDTTRYTDFKKELIGNTAVSSDMQTSISGGNEQTNFLIGIGTHKENTVFAKNLYGKRISSNISLNHATKDKKLSLSLSAGYSSNDSRLIREDLTKYINLPPNLLLYNADGSLAWEEKGVSLATVNNLVNPYAIFLKSNNTTNQNLFTNVQIQYNILHGLSIKNSVSYNHFRSDEVAITPKSAIDPISYAYLTASSDFANANTSNWSTEPQLNYHKTFGTAKFDFLIGGSWQEKKYRGSVINASQFSNDLLLNNPAAAGLVTSSITQSLYKYQALFGRVGFNLKERYLANISFRRDGSSRFGENKQFANFWAIGTGWIFTEEAFFKDLFPLMSFGKIRASYGITGNDQIGDYNFMQLWQSNAASGTFQGIPTIRPGKLYNPDYHWETNRKLELGLELGFLKNRLSLSGSYYNNRSSNQLVSYNLPSHTGFQSVVMNIPALVENKGLEFLANVKILDSKELGWSAAFNITLPSNKLLAYPDLQLSSYSSLYKIGHSLNMLNLYKFLGVDRATGIYSFEDVNGDGAIRPADDLQYAGNLTPKFYGGLSNTFRISDFSLDVSLEFKKQLGKNYLAELYVLKPGTIGNQPTIVLNRWQGEGDVKDIQKFTAGFNPALTTITNTIFNRSDALYSDASYIRLRNISLSYNLSGSLFAKMKMTSGKIFVSGQNLFTITNYKGLDPETQNFYALPPLRTLAIGLQVTF